MCIAGTAFAVPEDGLPGTWKEGPMVPPRTRRAGSELGVMCAVELVVVSRTADASVEVDRCGSVGDK